MKHLVLFLMVFVLCFPSFGETPDKNSQLLPERRGGNLPDYMDTPDGKMPKIAVLISLGTPQDLSDFLDNGGDPNTTWTIDKEAGDKISALRFALMEVITTTRGYQKFKVLLQKGADPNLSEMGTGWTVLHDAAIEAPAYIVETLLEYGADPLKPAVNGMTPYEGALRFANREAIQTIELKTEFRHPDREKLMEEGLNLRAQRKMKTQEGRRQ